jgi:hypothetical protein
VKKLDQVNDIDKTARKNTEGKQKRILKRFIIKGSVELYTMEWVRKWFLKGREED